MSLKEAGELMGLKPNSIRSRYKNGKIRGEADNMGKIWVWVDPSKIANDKGSKEPSSKVTNEGSKNNEIKALKAHIETLSEQLEKSQAELTVLRGRSNDATRFEAQIAGLDAQIVLIKEQRDHYRQEAQKGIEALLEIQKKPRKWFWQK